MSTDMGEIVAAMIAERETAWIADLKARKASRAEFSTDQKMRREYGLVARHRRKLARVRQERLA